MKRKLVVNDGRSEREVLLVGPIVIGRDPSCHISDLDPLLSRRHAEFVPRPTGLLVRDLGSRNGILVNGSKVPERLLISGDVVQLGHLQLRYVEEEVTEMHDLRHAEDTESSAAMIPPAHASGPADATRAPAAGHPKAADVDVTRLSGEVSDSDTTRITRRSIEVTQIGSENDDEDTHIPRRTDEDETVAPRPSKLATVAAPDEAQLVVDTDLIVRSTSASGQLIFGVRPETLVGGPLSAAIERSVQVLASAKGRPTLALFATRNESDKSIKMTFKAGQAVEPV